VVVARSRPQVDPPLTTGQLTVAHWASESPGQEAGQGYRDRKSTHNIRIAAA